jgi:transposase
MDGFRLTVAQRHELQTVLHGRPTTPRYRRALALLALDEGRSVIEVADLLGVSRQSVHNWVAAFRRSPHLGSLDDHYGGGRPMRWGSDLAALLRQALPKPPHHFGYPAANWTVPLLREHLDRATGLRLSDDTLRRQLHRLGYVWKRYRYVLPPDPEREKKTPPHRPHPAAAPAAGPAGRAGRG